MALLRRLLARLSARRAERRRAAAARRALADLFADPARLRGVSLRPEHRGRVSLLGYETDGDQIVEVRFAIVRHPRPHPFSNQVHEVVEYWRLDVAGGGPPERQGGVNLSRMEGGDGSPSTRPGPGI